MLSLLPGKNIIEVAEQWLKKATFEGNTPSTSGRNSTPRFKQPPPGAGSLESRTQRSFPFDTPTLLVRTITRNELPVLPTRPLRALGVALTGAGVIASCTLTSQEFEAWSPPEPEGETSSPQQLIREDDATSRTSLSSSDTPVDNDAITNEPATNGRLAEREQITAVVDNQKEGRISQNAQSALTEQTAPNPVSLDAGTETVRDAGTGPSLERDAGTFPTDAQPSPADAQPEVSRDQPPEVCPTQVFAGSCYEFFDELVSYDVARRRCARWGGHVAYAESRLEDDFLEVWPPEFSISVGDGYGMWLGARDGRVNGAFEWENRELLTFENFERGQPDNEAGVQCIEKRNDGRYRWFDQPCGSALRYVCEREDER